MGIQYIYHHYISIDKCIKPNNIVHVMHIILYDFRYHHFRRRPSEGISNVLTCVPKPGNMIDRWAVLVKDSDGNVIGKVPKDIYNIQDLVHHSVVRAHCIFTGEM